MLQSSVSSLHAPQPSASCLCSATKHRRAVAIRSSCCSWSLGPVAYAPKNGVLGRNKCALGDNQFEPVVTFGIWNQTSRNQLPEFGLVETKLYSTFCRWFLLFCELLRPVWCMWTTSGRICSIWEQTNLASNLFPFLCRVFVLSWFETRGMPEELLGSLRNPQKEFKFFGEKFPTFGKWSFRWRGAVQN